MKKITRLLLIFSLFVSICAIIFSSCNKKTEVKVNNEIKGKWRKLNVGDLDLKATSWWIFTDDSYYNTRIDSTDTYITKNDTITSGTYKVNVKFPNKRYINITADYEDVNGEWFVYRLTSTYMVVYRYNPGLEYLEFVKE